MGILEEWVNPWFLKSENIKQIGQDLLSKPYVKYTVLDNFFIESKLDEVIKKHIELNFDEEIDRRCHVTGSWLPYDASLALLDPESSIGRLLCHQEWLKLLCKYCHLDEEKYETMVKLRMHKPYADGFWIHTDEELRKLVAICYFNKNWTLNDGGLLQLWKQDHGESGHYFHVNDPKGRMDFLTSNRKISSTSLGGIKGEGELIHLSLLDQVLPQYNRLFLCNFRKGESFHSVTPSETRERMGFVQWII